MTIAPVVIISGPTGAGTTTLAGAISPIVSSLGVVGTDTIREVLRFVDTDSRTDRYRFVRTSSFRAWEELWRGEGKSLLALDAPICLDSPGAPTTRDVIEGYKRQADIVMESGCGIINRALGEGYSLIVEGVHARLAHLQDLPIERPDRVFRVFLDCSDSEKHRTHFEEDPKYIGRPRNPSRYLTQPNWGAIRAIRDFMVQESASYCDLWLDSATAPVHQLVRQFGLAFFPWLRAIEVGTGKRIGCPGGPGQH